MGNLDSINSVVGQQKKIRSWNKKSISIEIRRIIETTSGQEKKKHSSKITLSVHRLEIHFYFCIKSIHLGKQKGRGTKIR